MGSFIPCACRVSTKAKHVLFIVVIKMVVAALQNRDIVVNGSGEQLRTFCWVEDLVGGDLDAACEKALKQIEEKDYVAKLKQDGMKNFIKYGVACFKKICKVEIE